MDAKNRGIFEKTVVFRHSHFPKMVHDPGVTEPKRCNLRFCVCLAHFRFDPRPLSALYQGFEKLQIVKSRFLFFF